MDHSRSHSRMFKNNIDVEKVRLLIRFKGYKLNSRIRINTHIKPDRYMHKYV